jgi:hypothetical protein
VHLRRLGFAMQSCAYPALLLLLPLVSLLVLLEPAAVP